MYLDKIAVSQELVFQFASSQFDAYIFDHGTAFSLILRELFDLSWSKYWQPRIFILIKDYFTCFKAFLRLFITLVARHLEFTYGLDLRFNSSCAIVINSGNLWFSFQFS